MKKLRVLLADDHPVVREGARLIIEREPDCEVVAMAGNAEEAVSLAASLRPDVVVLDLNMPGGDSLAALAAVKKHNPAVELVIFSGERSEELIRKLFENGVKSYIRKTDIGDLLVDAIRAAAAHRPFFTPGVPEILFRRMVTGQSAPELTTREREIVRLWAGGKSNKDIANQLGISARTAETHRTNVMRKLGLSSTADVVRYAIRNGIVQA